MENCCAHILGTRLYSEYHHWTWKWAPPPCKGIVIHDSKFLESTVIPASEYFQFLIFLLSPKNPPDYCSQVSQVFFLSLTIKILYACFSNNTFYEAKAGGGRSQKISGSLGNLRGDTGYRPFCTTSISLECWKCYLHLLSCFPKC
jgi:hypothetical protein